MAPAYPIVDDDTSTGDYTDITTRDSTEAFVHTDRAFPEGTNDRLVLTKYDNHVTYILRQGDNRQSLKVTSHSLKMKNFPHSLMPEQVRRIFADFDLLEFISCSLTMLNTSLLTTFIEQ
ncbi:unnamed protein product [Vicia faba]|uniref:F-box domain-containing protein n=1 Tax=Vicia faba TaxID=3906 RepID=A0AAV1AUX4_VICFA|nr:unnamed protein product [Vicia faba]